MPCNSDYLNPTEREKNLSVVYGLLDELKTGKLPKNFGDGYDNRIYNKNFDKDHLDKKVSELCSKLQKIDVTKFSLEMQFWWREHQKADKERLLKEELDAKDIEDRKIALSKLSCREKKLLNL